MSFDRSVIVIDNGTGWIRAGYSRLDAPDKIIPTECGVTKVSSTHKSHSVFMPDVLCKMSKELGPSELQQEMELVSPIERGVVTDWDRMEDLWGHLLQSQLKADPEESKVLMTEGCRTPQRHREKMIQALFETLGCNAGYIHLQDVLALYSTGKRSGVVVNCGEGVCSILPIFEGYVHQYCARGLEFAGKDISKAVACYLNDRYKESIVDLNRLQLKTLVYKLKHSHCSVALPDQTQQSPSEFPTEETVVSDPCPLYVLPDGFQLTLSPADAAALQLSAEVLLTGPQATVDLAEKSQQLQLSAESEFRTALETPRLQQGVPSAVYDAVMATDVDCRKELFGNVVLTGGTSRLGHFEERLATSLVQLTGMSHRVKVSTTTEPALAAWLGGSILTDLSIFQNAWITRDDYNDTGPTVVYRKCIA